MIIIPSMQGGGAERVLLNLLTLINHREFDITLAIGEAFGPLLKQIPDGIARITLFPNQFLQRLSSYSLRWFGNTWLLQYFGRKIRGDYDAGVCFLDGIYTEFLFLNKATIRYKTAVVHSSYKSYSNKRKFISGPYRQRMIERYKKLDKVIFVSKESLAEFIDLFGEVGNPQVIYNPINIKDIREKGGLSIPIRKDPSKIQVLAIGSLLPVKGYPMLLDACSLLKARKLPFELHILGSGKMENELERIIRDKKLESHVHLHGFVNNPYSWLSAMDIFVMASESEGLPTVLCEAMILGAATVVPDISGCREISDHGKYSRMYTRSSTNLADALQELILDSTVRKKYQDLSIERAAIFDDEKAIQEYRKIFNGQSMEEAK